MSERHTRGAARIAELDGNHPQPRQEAYRLLAEVCPDLPRLAVEFAYGDIHSRPGLSAAQRELVTIGVLIALGDTERQLAAHLSGARTVGLEPHQLVEAVLQALPYAGFPRTVNAMAVARQMLKDRGELPVTPPGA
ncbi:carboxymuconolactone decarboxylase family protein [Actinoplanes sp. NPDC049548]|uniref:carboxymuconolactone decarboxylase family protein n=1 Tax=Actinoplanes sp. NPDC049548 TaxID=3155152 RepID=UPI0034214BBB